MKGEGQTKAHEGFKGRADVGHPGHVLLTWLTTFAYCLELRDNPRYGAPGGQVGRGEHSNIVSRQGNQ